MAAALGCGFDKAAPYSGPLDATPSAELVPSNFDPDLVTPSGGVTLDCAAIVTTDDPVAVGEWCGQPMPSIAVHSQQDGSEVVVLAVESLVVTASGTVSVRGARPLIIAVFGDAQLLGSIDVGPNGDVGGPGSGGPACDAAAGRRSYDNGGGGAGGGFGEPGGVGGKGALGAAGGSAGSAHGSVELIPLSGGCPGAQGGPSGTGGMGGVGGLGGGAVQVSAFGSLEVAGAIASSGAGGSGATRRNGGGGGGSGGAILLEAVQVTLRSGAILVANGGGGGEGGGSFNTTMRASGGDGSVSTAEPAPGGAGASASGGDGGDGGAANTPAAGGGSGSPDSGGGGGGGGSVGRIRINGAAACALEGSPIISPAATGNGAPGCP